MQKEWRGSTDKIINTPILDLMQKLSVLVCEESPHGTYISTPFEENYFLLWK
jgi:hypothetical protein